MDKIVVESGARLQGSVPISGAKNAALPLLASALLPTGASTFKNVPQLADVVTMGKLLRMLGWQVEGAKGTLQIAPGGPDKLKLEAPYELVKTMRASVLVLGPLVARYGRGRVSMPGGCAIGARPIDQHLKGLEAMGAKITLDHGYVEAEAKRLRGAPIVLDIPTDMQAQFMVLACIAKGESVIKETIFENRFMHVPELGRMGADIHVDGRVAVIKGGRKLAGASVMATDLRASASLVLAGLVASGRAE